MTHRVAFIVFFLAGAVVSGQELITLTVPESVPTNDRYRIERINITVDNPDTGVDEASAVCGRSLAGTLTGSVP